MASLWQRATHNCFDKLISRSDFRLMMAKLTRDNLVSDFQLLGVDSGDTVLIRASLGAVGRIDGGADTFINALLECIGEEGTIVSLAFTSGAFLKTPKKEDAFSIAKKSYAGALPNTMLNWPGSHRSRHPMCSYVAVGKNAESITKDHNENSPAYEPIRKIINLGGKCILVGCAKSSPGFTTTHLAEADLGYLEKLPVLPWLRSVYYESDDGCLKLFRRKDPGLCSNSFYKFYALYVREGLLSTGFVGNAYSISAPAKECYEVDIDALSKNQKFNLCDSKDCWTCNAGRWDRIYRAPGYYLRKIAKKARSRFSR